MSNQELAKGLHKPIIRKFENKKYTHLLQIIFGVLILLICNQYVNLIEKFVFYYVLLIFSVYAWVIPLKDKNSITITVFPKILDESNRKPNKTWVDKGSEFSNNSMKSWQKKIPEKCILPVDVKPSTYTDLISVKRIIRKILNLNW